MCVHYRRTEIDACGFGGCCYCFSRDGMGWDGVDEMGVGRAQINWRRGFSLFLFLFVLFGGMGSEDLDWGWRGGGWTRSHKVRAGGGGEGGYIITIGCRSLTVLASCEGGAREEGREEGKEDSR